MPRNNILSKSIKSYEQTELRVRYTNLILSGVLLCIFGLAELAVIKSYHSNYNTEDKNDKYQDVGVVVYKKYDHDWYDYTAIVSQIFLGLSAVAASFAILFVTRRQSLISEQQTKISAQQVDISIAVQRAFVSYDCYTLRIYQSDTPNEVWEIGQRWKNSGPTSAKNINYYIDFNMLPIEVNNIPHWEFPEEKISEFSMGPGMPYSTDAFPLKMGDLVSMYEKKTRLYVRTLCLYHDIFPNTPLRSSNLVIEYVINVKPDSFDASRSDLSGVIAFRGRVCYFSET